jgi:hypothetical protein
LTRKLSVFRCFFRAPHQSDHIFWQSAGMPVFFRPLQEILTLGFVCAGHEPVSGCKA